MRIRRPEYILYGLLCRYGALSSTQAARKMGTDTETIEHLIERLNARGYVVTLEGEGSKQWTPKVPF